MPGKNVSKVGPLSPDEIALREELRADVQKLAGEIGERNMWHYPQLNAAADFIEDSFSRAGLRTRRDSYEIRGQLCHNIEVEIPGNQPEIIVIGAHYDSVFGSPGANDNGSGAAAVLALAKRFAARETEQGAPQRKPNKTLRFVAFVNEEPPYFLSGEMGSQVYARRCKERGDKISAMISLETIGYFSDAPGSQTYPVAGPRLVLSERRQFHSALLATFIHARCYVASSRCSANTRTSHLKAPRFPAFIPE
jgi:acetylornithine deacetylase/succinyl-diaminopimelate desuccinylase-like protein